MAVGSPGLPSCHVIVSTNTGGFTLEKTSKFQRSDKIVQTAPTVMAGAVYSTE